MLPSQCVYFALGAVLALVLCVVEAHTYRNPGRVPYREWCLDSGAWGMMVLFVVVWGVASFPVAFAVEHAAISLPGGPTQPWLAGTVVVLVTAALPRVLKAIK
jgi:hypothetical protein